MDVSKLTADLEVRKENTPSGGTEGCELALSWCLSVRSVALHQKHAVPLTFYKKRRSAMQAASISYLPSLSECGEVGGQAPHEVHIACSGTYILS